ncbi:MAG: hypothetical protein WD208_08220 [Dehalococcoidia bacterium]
MNERENAARTSGGLKVFLKADEVGLLAAALTWMRTDISFTRRLLDESAPDEVKTQVPDELFANWSSLLETVHKTLVIHALADTQEMEDREARQHVEDSVKMWIEQGQQAQQVANAVRAAVLAEAPPQE